MTSHKIIVGIDLGGTNVRCAVADSTDPSTIIIRRTAPTPSSIGPAALVDFIFAEVALSLREAGLERAQVMSVGCAAPGITDAENGRVISAANLAGWRDVALAEMLQNRFGSFAAIENDIRAAALGESRYGAGRGRRSLIYMTVSTGISAGIVIDGKPLRGTSHSAGEIAYMLPEPIHIGKDWGENGCLELTAAGIGIAKEWAAKHPDARKDFSAAEVFSQAQAGDAEARRIVDRASDYLAQAAVALCTVIDPEILVLGGGIVENIPRLLNRIQEVVHTTLPFPPPVVLSALKGDAELRGALALAAEKSPKSV